MNPEHRTMLVEELAQLLADEFNRGYNAAIDEMVQKYHEAQRSKQPPEKKNDQSR